MAIYDKSGNEIFSGVSNEQIRLAFANALVDGTIKVLSHVGDTLGLNTANYPKNNMDTAYASLLAAYKASPTGIPFFIHSDQHGRGMEIQRYANNLDVDGMEYANINGGDSCVDTYGKTALEYVHNRIRLVKNYLAVPGNHDYKPSSETISPFVIRQAFGATNLESRFITTSDLCCYVAYQPCHTVKYICLDLYDQRGVVSGMAHPYVNAEVADWLIRELNRNDGYDIVVIMHEPQWITYKDRSSESYSTSTNSSALFALLLARRNRSSGTFTDNESKTHSYDFTDAENELLCVFSGHQHAELYSDADGLTVYAQDWAGNNKYGGTFGLIDRDNDLLRIFRFDAVNGNFAELDLSLQFTVSS